MNCILVTGGAGFIGSHLCKTILQNDLNCTVVCLDNLMSSTEKHVTTLKTQYPNRFTFIHHDVTLPLPHSIRNLNISEIYHLACPASPVFYQKYPIQTLNTCYIGTQNILEFAATKKAKVLYTSTSEVYGDPITHPQSEDYTGNVHTTSIRACYDEGKRVAETLCTEYTRKGVDVRIVRIFNTYGPHLHPNDGRVVSNFIRQALRCNSLTVFGDGTQTRSFCYVSDTVDALLKLMKANPDGTEIHTPINIGNSHEMTINEIAAKVLDMTRSTSSIVYNPLPEADPKQRCPDIAKAQRLLKWSPKVSLKDGLQQTIDYFKNTI